MLTAPLRAIVFDLDGTLVDIAAARARFAARHGAADLTSPPRESRARFLRRVARTSCVDLTTLTARYPRDIATDAPRATAAIATLATACRTHNPAFRLAVLSNGDDTVQRAKLRHVAGDAAGAFDPIIISGATPWRKPSPRLLDHLFDLLDVAPARTLFVGDRDDVDLAPARARGAATLLVDPAWRVPDDVVRHTLRVASNVGVVAPC